MEIRPVTAEQYEALGALTVAAFRSLGDGSPLGPYEDELRDVAAHALDCEVYVAVDEGGNLLGGVTYVPGPATSMSEFTDPAAAGIRVLAVDPRHRGVGAGGALARHCVEMARARGARRVLLHSTGPMVLARAMYERMGFVREESIDVWITEAPHSPASPLHLLGYRLEL
jgi:predicted N-acetyltransferase YhbS